jgi:Domain of unknown function (DUF4743)
MRYLDHVQACNRLDLRDSLPLTVDGVAAGWVLRRHAALLADYPAVFAVATDQVSFASRLTTPAARSAALAGIARTLQTRGLCGRLRGELYAAKTVWSAPSLFTLDRAMVSALGVRAYGIHVNGIVRRGDECHLWIGTRATDREVEPGKLDNMVAGGQPADLSLTENLVKECGEEADLSPEIARTAKPVGVISYAFSTSSGAKIDTLFCYDLEMPPGTEPRNRDGEIAGFTLMPATEALELVRTTDRFKFNVNLVLIDFALRHGLIKPDDEPDYERLMSGLHRRTDPDPQGFIQS